MKEMFTTTATGVNSDAGIPMKEQGGSVSALAQVLLSRFDLVRSLGLSGTSHLFLAHDHSPDRISSLSPGDHVILKLLSTDAASDPDQVELFHLEALAAAGLAHGNIVNSSEAYGVGGLHLCTIERKANVESLRRRLDRSAWLEVQDAINIICDLASALESAHRSGILHLNIAPESVLLDCKGVAFVTGFGIEATRGRELHRRRSRALSAHYQSPEQAAGEPLDSRSDLYSVGALLFEMLTDRPPFVAENLDAIRSKQMARPAPSAQLFRPDVPDLLSQIVKRLLEKVPDERFQTAGELLSALNQLRDRTIVLDRVSVQSRRVPDEVISTLESSCESEVKVADETRWREASPERGHESIPDDIDLVGSGFDGEDDVGTCYSGASILNLLNEEAGSPLCQVFECELRDKAVSTDFDERPLRAFFEAPLIEAIAPGELPPQLSGTGLRRTLQNSEHRPDPTEQPFRKPAITVVSSSSGLAVRHLVLLVASFLCLLALVNSSNIARISGPSTTTSASGASGEDMGDSAAPPPSVPPSTPERESILERQALSATQVGVSGERRRRQRVRRSDRNRTHGKRMSAPRRAKR
jgi:serine/threonine protein kinase